jgi:hypothetical protein
MLKLKLLLLICFGLTRLNAPTASGGDASGSGGSASYSIGQVFYTSGTGSGGSVAQGVQQSYEISIVDGIEEAKDITLLCMAYPNPTTDFIILKVEKYDSKDLSFQLYNINGKLLVNKKIGANETSIDMSNFVDAIYFLKICDSNNEVKIFKIIKN